MNKKQLFLLLLSLCMAASMVWFPGSWFGYIIDGYPVLKPDSMAFLVKAMLPLTAFTLFFLYCLRDSTASAVRSARLPARGPRRIPLFTSLLILGTGLLCGFIGAYYLMSGEGSPVQQERAEGVIRGGPVDNDFRNFCRREGYRKEAEALTTWLMAEHADSIAILYNEDDAYSSDLYTYFSEHLSDARISVALSDAFREGERSFSRELLALESAKPEAIVFLGSYEERVAFLETIAQQKADFWKKRLDKIRWIE